MTGTSSIDVPVRIAAFFDLDKTVIATSSVLAFSRPFYDGGLMTRRTVLKSSYAQFMYLLTSADRDQVTQLRKHITEMCRGWDVAQVSAIVHETLDEVVEPLIFAEAAELIADHRRRGHDVVLVSASGREVVEPIGELIGVHHVRASEMEIVDGHYTGELRFYCYGEEKAVAITEMAATHGYELAECFAYSDSVTDVPMLSAVGHPTAVNPDRQLRKHATEQGWDVLTFAQPVAIRERLVRRSSMAGAAFGLTVVATVIGVITLRHLLSRLAQRSR